MMVGGDKVFWKKIALVHADINRISLIERRELLPLSNYFI